jgi:hypothetical protein
LPIPHDNNDLRNRRIAPTQGFRLNNRAACLAMQLGPKRACASDGGRRLRGARLFQCPRTAERRQSGYASMGVLHARLKKPACRAITRCAHRAGCLQYWRTPAQHLPGHALYSPAGQHATVLRLPAQTKSAAEAEVHVRGAHVGGSCAAVTLLSPRCRIRPCR